MDTQSPDVPEREDLGEATPEKGRVAPLGDLKTHYWLALEMSRTVGLDLQAELEADRISHSDWANMVSRCRGCSWAGECPAWMSAMRALEDVPPPAAPGSCVNAERFNALLAMPDDDDGPSQ
ncbi:MAG: DUF6455 family protein [Pseudomonadota bacterium]